jgi:hypothetical protein
LKNSGLLCFASPLFKSQYDSSLFLCKTPTGLVLLLVYVDDIVIIGTDSTLIGHLKQNLQAFFHMKDLGPLKYFLGLEVQRILQVYS